jgi:hypothetical protein
VCVRQRGVVGPGGGVGVGNPHSSHPGEEIIMAAILISRVGRERGGGGGGGRETSAIRGASAEGGES